METLEKKGKGSALLPFLLFIIIYLGAGCITRPRGWKWPSTNSPP